MLRNLLRAMRPRQWTKNVFALAPLVFAQELREPTSLARALLAFSCFCLASSAVYLVNDVRDREEDRRHPLKRLRPIAAGLVPVSTASAAAAALGVAAVAAGWVLGKHFLVLLLLYLALNLLYSGGLKKVVILDVMTLAVGFVLRVMGGAAAIDVVVSAWLLLCTIFVSLLLAVSKRRHELILLSGDAPEQRSVLSLYSPALLDQMINVVTASSLLAYALYAVSPETVAKFHTDGMIFTIPFVLFGIFRYLYLVYQSTTELNPTESMLRDAPFLVNILLWGAAVLWIVYAA